LVAEVLEVDFAPVELLVVVEFVVSVALVVADLVSVAELASVAELEVLLAARTVVALAAMVRRTRLEYCILKVVWVLYFGLVIRVM